MDNIRYLLPREGKFFKANLHCHSVVSDGGYTPEMLKEAYALRGYQIIAYTDHRICVPHGDLSDGQFLALTGTELDSLSSPGDTGWEKACHLCCISRDPTGCERMPQLPDYSFRSTSDTVELLNRSGFIVHFNHPAWSAQSTPDYVGLQGLHGFEVYNHCSQAYAMEGLALNDFALFLKGGGKAYPVAADDNHNLSKNKRFITDSFGGFTMIKAPELTYDSVISALDQAHVYASTGPLISEYFLAGKRLHVASSPVSKAVLKTARVGVNKQNVIMPSDTITQVDFDLSGASGFAYVELYAQDGTFACTAPVYAADWADK